MSKVDEHGVVHPTEEDLLDVQAMTHIAFCPVCNKYALPQNFWDTIRENSDDAVH